METLLLHMPARFPLENVAYLDLSHLFSGRRFLYFCAEEVAQQNGPFLLTTIMGLIICSLVL